MMENQSCKYCLYWGRWEKLPTMGSCRKRAPVTNDLNDTLFPPMGEHEWCGDFARRVPFTVTVSKEATHQ